MSQRDVAELLRAVEDLEEAYEGYSRTRRRRTREYVRREHVAFLDQRFRTFDEYLAIANPPNFQHYVRFTPQEFHNLFGRIRRSMLHPMFHVSPISGLHRFFIFLRYVAHGYTFAALAEEVHCGKATIRQIVYEVADAITRELFAEAFPAFTRRDLEEVAKKTQQRYDYPCAVGFMDGKHIRIRKPAHSGTMYFNYKRFFSIILLAVVDCDYRILAFDLGAPGRVGDAGVFRNSRIKRFFEERDDIFPPTRTLGNVGPVQYHILVDCGFAQHYRYVRPYSQAAADTPSKRRFNEKHSGARRIEESTFGILCRRFAILQKAILLEPDNAIKVVTAILVRFHLFIWNSCILITVVSCTPQPDRQKARRSARSSEVSSSHSRVSSPRGNRGRSTSSSDSKGKDNSPL